MKTKKIIAETMPLALKMVRQQLGENAIIVNTRTIKTGGVFGLFAKQKYEVTAYASEKENDYSKPQFTLDLKEKPSRNITEKQQSETKRKNVSYNQIGDETTEKAENNSSIFNKSPQKLYNYYSQQTPVMESPAEKPVESSIQNSEKPKADESQMMDELQHMKKMMMSLMLNDHHGNAFPSSLTGWVNRLKKQGVDEEVVDAIVESLLKKYESLNDLNDKAIKDEIFSVVKGIIEKKVPNSHSIPEQTRMINVIGPTGVGKTTSIAKLATEQVLKQKRRVAMITTDVYRIAAVEQLKTYAGILNVPIEVVRSKDELESALKKLEHSDLIYMDSTGRNYKELQYRDSINEYLNYPVESDNYLVLSLTTKYEDMQILLNGFLNTPVKKLILTKFDETSSYGSILNIAYKYPYQLAYITNGQSVPEDITTIDALQLARDILGVEK